MGRPCAGSVQTEFHAVLGTRQNKVVNSFEGITALMESNRDVKALINGLQFDFNLKSANASFNKSSGIFRRRRQHKPAHMQPDASSGFPLVLRVGFAVLCTSLPLNTPLTSAR